MSGEKTAPPDSQRSGLRLRLRGKGCQARLAWLVRLECLPVGLVDEDDGGLKLPL